MIIQSERVWIAGQFLPAQILIENGKIAAVLKRGSRNADRDYGSHAVLPGFIQTTGIRQAFGTGWPGYRRRE